ncbi:2Fe-2S iron-sulfur cluster-binding protein [Halalkalicoccus sp. NIPERK01]|uniref:2Fe-2S iron-sulfur cluster-binding protein n=1 Tax=Halalkalicoccus sp. NIPERK01 TaxID=3053469 RepID=UPI00256F0492|nr:2Fe-2S iron-sulfur cluster-binding protein [Halalkalicoccus sp. NIPERK01]MDL5362077.1 2Fe-2S iron-sulfur cluster-binding protein [Halalkalicoccus sp. NIPERK01]
MVDVFAFSIGAFLTLVVVALHFAKGTERPAADDIVEEVLERRAATVPETDFPEPMNRAIGGGGGAAAAVAGGGEAEGELEEGGTEEAAGPGDIPEDEIEYYEVEFVKEGETIELANNEPILDQGEDHGWDLPYACRQGQCVSCGARITDGPSEDYVVHDNQQMLDDNELEEGYTLTCVAYPRGEFSIETNETP